MPELPEVESIRLSLAARILGKTIEDVEVRWPPAAVSLADEDFSALAKNRTIESLDRRGKYLLMNLSHGLTMIIHFRMTGRLIYYPEQHEPNKHTHVVFRLDQGELHYSDIRKFGRIQLVSFQMAFKAACLAKLGPEPLDESFTFDQLGMRLARRKSTIKAALLDQTVVAGIGNIYADEALFRAGILPDRNTASLKVSEIILLYDAICEVLQEGIMAGGTSFRDYRDADGKKGAFQENLMVYGRSGQECKYCGGQLAKIKVVGRTTVYCPNCQR